VRLPFLWVLLGILGGLESFGFLRPVPRPCGYGGADVAMREMDRANRAGRRATHPSNAPPCGTQPADPSKAGLDV